MNDTPTPKVNSWWNSYRTGRISAQEFMEAIQNLERENAALISEKYQLIADVHKTTKYLYSAQARGFDLRQENTLLKKDKDRLDWINAEPYLRTNEIIRRYPLTPCNSSVGMVRASIDAARKEQP